MKKILFVEQYSEISGAEIIAIKTLTILKEKFNIEIISILPQRGTLSKELEKLGGKNYYFHIPKIVTKQSKKVIALNFIKKIIKKENIDVLYSNMIRGGYYAAKVGIKEHIPMIWHLNENISLMKFIYIDPLLKNKYVYLIAVSPKVKKSFKLKKTVIIENPISNKIKYNNDFNIHNFGYIGRVIPVKGVHNALLNLAELNKVLPNIIFYIYGDERNLNSDYKNEIIHLTRKYKLKLNIISYVELIKELSKKLGIYDQVKIMGHENDLNKIYQNFSILLVPSTKKQNEAFGLIAFEGMRAGNIVFTSNTGAFKDYIIDGENGYKINFLKNNILKREILKLKNQPTLINTIRKNGFEFSKKFSEKKFKRKIIEYFSILE